MRHQRHISDRFTNRIHRAEPVRFDAVFRVADAPQITKDTLGKDSGYPLFGLRTSPLHLDIPIPDPPAYGSNGDYVWPDRSELVPWEEKVNRLVFRGSASFSFGVENWQTNPRIRLAQLSSAHPDLIDAGLTTFRPKPMGPLTSDSDAWSRHALFSMPSAEQIQRMSNVTLAKKMTFRDQSQFKYVLDVDGGLGSSRRVGLLKSGSVPFFVDSPYYGNFEKLLVPWVHYVPVDEFLVDLVDKVRWLQDHEEHARFIVENAIKFADTYLSVQAAKEQLADMLTRYSDLLADDVDLDDSDVPVDFCSVPGTK